MSIAVDSSTPTPNLGTGTTISSTSFSPPAASLLVVTYGSHNASTISSISDSLGTHLTYSKLIGYTSGDCDSEIWVADCSSAETGMTVTVTLSASANGAVGVVVLTGAKAAASQTGATNSGEALSGSPSVAVTTAANGSLVIGSFGTRISTSPASTIPGGQTDVFGSSTLLATDGNGQYQWVQTTTSPTSSSGTNVTINNTVTGEWTEVVAEILASGAGPTPNPLIASGFFMAM